MTIREKLEQGMVPGRGYSLTQLRRMAGDACESSMWIALRKMRLAGTLETTKKGHPARASYRLLRSIKPAPDPDAPPAPRRLHPLERVPAEQVKPHIAIVGQRELWRGKSWRDMPGREPLVQKCNFFLWRRGMLSYHQLPPGRRKLLMELRGV